MAPERKPAPPDHLAELDLGDLLLPQDERAPTRSGFVTRAENRPSQQPSIPRASGLPVVVATGGRPPAASSYHPIPLPKKKEPSPTSQLVNLVVASVGFILAAMLVTWLIYR